jgi:hypothetical protein
MRKGIKVGSNNRLHPTPYPKPNEPVIFIEQYLDCSEVE